MDFNEDCVQAVKIIEGYMTAVPKLIHADEEKVKEIFVVIGASAFATSIWQVNEDSQPSVKELVAFWSKV